MGLLERRLEATMTRMQKRSEHAQALQQYATVKDEMAGLGARAQRAREMKATLAASERKRLVDTMTQEMKDVEAEMDTKLRRTVESMDVDMQHMVAEDKAEAMERALPVPEPSPASTAVQFGLGLGLPSRNNTDGDAGFQAPPPPE